MVRYWLMVLLTAVCCGAGAVELEIHPVVPARLEQDGTLLFQGPSRSSPATPGFSPTGIWAGFHAENLLLKFDIPDLKKVGTNQTAIPVEGKKQQFRRSSGRITLRIDGEENRVETWDVGIADLKFQCSPPQMKAKLQEDGRTILLSIPRSQLGRGPWRVSLSCQTLFFTSGDMVGRENSFRYPEQGNWLLKEPGAPASEIPPRLTGIKLVPHPGAVDMELKSDRKCEYEVILTDRNGKTAGEARDASLKRNFFASLVGLEAGEYRLQITLRSLDGRSAEFTENCRIPAAETSGTPDFWLQARGRHIVDSQGKPFRLIGMARCQYHAPYERKIFGPVAEQFRYFRSKGLNAVRIAFGNTDEENTKADFYAMGFDAYIDKYIEPEVRAAIEAGLYVILDAHHISGTLEAAERRIPLWEAIARRYADEPGVAIYEIWNESYLLPTGLSPASAPALRELFKKTIRAIRKYDRRHLIMVSDWNAGWGHATETMWAPEQFRIDEPYRQVVFSKHMAKDHSNAGFFNSALDAVAERWNIPLVIGEMELEPGLADPESLTAFIAEQSRKPRNYSVLFWRPHPDEMIHTAIWSRWAKQAASPVPFAKPLPPEEQKPPQPPFAWTASSAGSLARTSREGNMCRLLPELPQYGSAEIRLPREFSAGRYRLRVVTGDSKPPFASIGIYLGLNDDRHLSIAALSRSARPVKRETIRYFYTDRPFGKIHIKKLDPDAVPGIGIESIELQPL